jgi:hypothetical protein
LSISTSSATKKLSAISGPLPPFPVEIGSATVVAMQQIHLAARHHSNNTPRRECHCNEPACATDGANVTTSSANAASRATSSIAVGWIPIVLLTFECVQEASRDISLCEIHPCRSSRVVAMQRPMSAAMRQCILLTRLFQRANILSGPSEIIGRIVCAILPVASNLLPLPLQAQAFRASDIYLAF